jgi:hypothetical protein
MRTSVCALLIGVALSGARAQAQAADVTPSPRAHRVTVTGGLIWSGGYDIGDATAALRGNAVGASAPPFTLFTAQTSVDPAAGVEARVGFAVTRDLAVETGFSYQQPGLTTQLASDAEIPAVSLDAERLAQYVVDVAAVWQLPRLRLGARMRPFVIAGGGYLRQLYEERTLVETGSLYFAGGGVRYWLRGGDGVRRGVGLRTDARAQWRRDGVEFEGKTRLTPAVTAHVFVEF